MIIIKKQMDKDIRNPAGRIIGVPEPLNRDKCYQGINICFSECFYNSRIRDYDLCLFLQIKQIGKCIL